METKAEILREVKWVQLHEQVFHPDAGNIKTPLFAGASGTATDLKMYLTKDGILVSFTSAKKVKIETLISPTMYKNLIFA